MMIDQSPVFGYDASKAMCHVLTDKKSHYGEGQKMEEKKIQQLNTDQMDKITGGKFLSSQDKSESFEKHECKGKCNRKTVFKMYSGGRGVCSECGWVLQ